MKTLKISKLDALEWCEKEIEQYKDKNFLNIEIKQWKPEKTNKQLGLFFKALDFFCKTAGYSESDKYWVRKGIEQEYSFKKENALGQFVTIPLSECNRFEEFNQFLKGLFTEAGNQGIDMGPFVKQWDQIKAERIRDRLKQNTVV